MVVSDLDQGGWCTCCGSCGDPMFVPSIGQGFGPKPWVVYVEEQSEWWLSAIADMPRLVVV